MRDTAPSPGDTEIANDGSDGVKDWPPRVYGDPAKFRASLRRLVASGQDLLGRLEGVKRVIKARGEEGRLVADVREEQWTTEVERWHRRVWSSLHRHLADGASDVLPTTTVDWPLATGKPRHARRISWVEPWLAESLGELSQLEAKLDGPRATKAPGSSVSPATPFGNKRRFATLVSSATGSLWWFDCHLGRAALALIYEEADVAGSH